MAERGKARRGLAMQGLAGHGSRVMASLGAVRCGSSSYGLAGQSCLGTERRVMYRRVEARQSRRGDVVLGTVRFCMAAQALTS